MEKKEIIEKAIARLTDEEYLIYLNWLAGRGYCTHEDMIKYDMECYAFEENLTSEQVYNDCLEIINDLK